MYTSRAAVVEAFGWREIAGLCDSAPFLLVADEALFRDAINAADLSGYNQSEQDAATAAMQRLDSRIERASRMIDQRLATRYKLPIGQARLAQTDIPGIAADFTRYLLNDDKPSEHVRQTFEDGMAHLKALSAGRASIPGIESNKASSGSMAIVAPPGVADDAIARMVS